MYERQFIEFDEEWLSIAALEKEANREAAEERSGGKLRKRGEDRARSYAAAANRDTTTETGRPALTAGEKRKTAPTSPDGARPAPAAPIQGAASNQQLVSTQPPQYIQQPPSEQGEWVLVRGLHWLRNRGSEGLRLWDRLGDEEIASIFSTGRNREVGDITRLQLLLLQAQPPRDRSRWSPLQTAVSSFVAEQTHNTTHPVAQLSRRSPGVLLGANGVYNHVDYTVQLFFDALVRMHDTLRGTYPEHYASLFQRIHAVLGRPGRYREMVRRLDRAAEDPEPTATLLESSNIFHATSFTHPADITELDAVRYMWEVLRIPHTVVSRALEPYAQRFERHNIAMDIMHRLFIQDRALPEQQQSLQWISRNHASRAFRAQSVLSFGIRSVVLFASGPIVGWAEPTESMEPTTGEVDVSMAWLPNSIRTRFEEEYWSRIQQRERQ
ncbi:hypothetical protein FRC09_002867 [Ceratobasidium sp. 395]|nr:hypothetical protein FRC09_002867 [Ceratobasidium sp. 395]